VVAELKMNVENHKEMRFSVVDGSLVQMLVHSSAVELPR
jgi:hypothetical protein